MPKAYPTVLDQLFRLGLFLLLSGLGSCIGFTRYSIYANNSASRIPIQKIEPDSNLHFVVPELQEDPAISKSKILEQTLFPAIFVWKSEHTYQTLFQQALVTNYFQRQLKEQADKQGITKALKNRKLVLEADRVPAGFTFSQNVTLVYLLLFAITEKSYTIYPSQKQPVLHYRLVADTTILQAGKVRGRNSCTEPVFLPTGNIQQSFHDFVDSYQHNLQILAMEMIRDLKSMLKLHVEFPPENKEARQN